MRAMEMRLDRPLFMSEEKLPHNRCACWPDKELGQMQSLACAGDFHSKGDA
jgi:hypothetical protein